MGLWLRLLARVFGAPRSPLNVNLDDLRVHYYPSKPCIVPGCGGTMKYEPAALKARADEYPHMLELEWRSTFVCDKDRMHAKVLSRDEDKAMWREHRKRTEEANAEMLCRINHARAESAKSKREPL